MESRKTTTISFRIDDSLKRRLSHFALLENKTITVKAKEALTEYLAVNPIVKFSNETKTEIFKIDDEIRLKINSWKTLFENQFESIENQNSSIKANEKLINDYHFKMKNLISQIEKEQNKQKRQCEFITTKMIILSIATILCNGVISAILIKYLAS